MKQFCSSYTIYFFIDFIDFLISKNLLQYGEPVARFKHHKGAITSVEWCPQETTTLIASGEDDQITIWDLAVEAEGSENIPEVPPQLLFVHMGQTEIKEARDIENCFIRIKSNSATCLKKVSYIHLV